MSGTVWLLALGCLLASGCASVLDGTRQRLSVETRYKDSEVIGATCTLSNDRGSWRVVTPGSVIVNRSLADLSADCEKEGFAAGTLVVESAHKALALVYMVVGGVVGTIVDAVTGAAYDYPASVTVGLGGGGFSVVNNSAEIGKSQGTAERTLQPDPGAK